MAKVKSSQMAYEMQLLDPELVFQMINFTNFLSVWLIRQADPKKTHPSPPAESVFLDTHCVFSKAKTALLDCHYPRKFQCHSGCSLNILLKTLSTRCISLSSQFFGINFLCLLTESLLCSTSPEKFELSGKDELLTFTLTFLTSTWYIKNPFLKSRINDVYLST